MTPTGAAILRYLSPSPLGGPARGTLARIGIGCGTRQTKGRPNILRAVAFSDAKLVAGEAALKDSRACIQVHGGMGYTWEVPAHYYLKRTWVLNSVFGSPEDHADEVAERVGVAAA